MTAISNFFGELWKRRVVQFGAIYLGVAWVLLQVVATVEQTLHLPDWVAQVALVFLGLGFPILLILAWTREPLSHIPVAQPAAKAGADTPAIAPAPVAPAPDDASIAVLPFVNMSADPEQEYFSDGLTEELLNQLAQFKELDVIARTSCFTFKGKNEDVRVIGQKLGVAHVLEGSVRKSGNRIRITAQLIKCADHHHLWSQAYDRDLDDIFAIQDDVAGAVARALGVALGLGSAMPTAAATTTLAAYDKYLRATALNRSFVPADLHRAADMLRETLALDPDFAPARGALAVTYNFIQVYMPEAGAQMSKELDETVRDALARAPDHWASHLANGMLLTQRRQWLLADAALAKARSLAPSSEMDIAWIASVFLDNVGRVGEAIGVLEAARNTDPLSLIITAMLQQSLDMAGRTDEAKAEYVRTRDLPGNREPSEHQALLRILDSDDAAAIRAQADRMLSSQTVQMPVLNELFERLDQPQAALGLVRGAFDDPANQDSTRMFILGLYAGHFGDNALALAAMRRAFVGRDSLIPYFIWYPAMREARKTPEFKQLVRDLGIYDYWRQSSKWGDFARPKGEDDFEIIR